MNWKLDEQLCFLLYASSRNVIKAYKDILDPFGLTYTQYITMIALWEQDHQLVSELGDKLQLDSGTLTPLLKKLEKDGRVTRVRDQEDQRKVYINLTKAGKDLGVACQVVPERLLQCVQIDFDKAKQLYFILKGVYNDYLEGDKS
ncbi:MarR family winged helix-turn-helix transcriptional regulator [Paracholeplasma manati]|jgi:DNA-binding MarR family transcriptional regulator|uniref:HTH-type transcriptional regulator SarZ n=1 Tax=Paracholeplasma manati TaxID=591373 RepID=A0ABT2Y567_9MOLU|nr:MarR family transcriptional regulator [Paracholeplasma manati]MCV2231876.1 MarR family transcriptional regulator [Paracholeplasma manati]MDG0889122.1 MarR family transcriptional regulator [Paracholeplasma manati]